MRTFGSHGPRFSKRIETRSTKVKEELTNEMLRFEKDQAKAYFGSRSEKSQAQDLALKAKRTITDREIAKNSEVLKAWYRNPNQIDIEGVDK